MVKQRFKYETSYTFDPQTARVTSIIDRPTLPITLEYNGKYRPVSAPVNCLLDSGSDMNLFPEHFAYGLGITDIDSRPEHPIKGIGNISITGHDVFNIKLYVGDKKSSINFSTWICFSPEQTVPLLGIDGFFNNFKNITFMDNAFVELEF